MKVVEVAVYQFYYATKASFPRSALPWAAGMLVFACSATLPADVVVIANRLPEPVTFQLTSQTAAPATATLARGEVRPFFTDEPLRISFAAKSGRKSYLLDPNCAYFFGASATGEMDLQKLGLHEDASTQQGRSLPGNSRTAPAVIVPVKIVVDDEEPARQEIWERRLRKRVDEASAILLKHCGVGFRVVSAERWDSDDSIDVFEETLRELEREVKLENAQVAIAFANQYQLVEGRFHMGGTKGPFHSHILLREWSRLASENERLELLVHELGHWLGAAHSPEPDSVMRPVLSDRQSRRVGFEIKFDPVNTLAMALVGEEVRRRRVTSFSNLTPGTRKRLAQIYAALAPTLPDDPAAKQFQNLTGGGADLSLAAATKQVVAAMTRASQQNRGQFAGDQLTEDYIQTAARMAADFPPEVAPQAFLRAIGIGLDTTGTLAKLPAERSFINSVDTAAERAARSKVLGKPTMRDRNDLTLHFAVSAYLAVTSGSGAAETAGYLKETLDAQGGSGFSFADLAADRAGVRFAEGVLKNRFKLPILAKSFTVRDFVPNVDDLPEGLQSADFARDYGGKGDKRFELLIKEIDRRIDELPPYR